MNDVKSLSHTKWRCKYHIVFAPKYRRQAIYGKLKVDIGKILRDLCNRKHEYIRNQLQEDIEQDTLNFKEYTDPFTGDKSK